MSAAIYTILKPKNKKAEEIYLLSFTKRVPESDSCSIQPVFPVPKLLFAYIRQACSFPTR